MWEKMLCGTMIWSRATGTNCHNLVQGLFGYIKTCAISFEHFNDNGGKSENNIG